MFYRPEEGHGLAHNPFNALIAPRPIAWIATRSREGIDNLAPYSFFNGAAYDPPQVMFATTGPKPDRHLGKDTLANIDETGVFCVHMVEEAATRAMNVSSEDFPAGVDEFTRAGLKRVECETIACSRIEGAPAALECRLVEIVRLPGAENHVCIGEVTGIHMRDDCLVNGRFDITRFSLLARLGYRDYAVVREVFTLARPDD